MALRSTRKQRKAKKPQLPALMPALGTPEQGKKQKKKIDRERRGRITLGVLVSLAAIAVAFFIWARAQGDLSLTENAIGSLIAPVQNGLKSATTWVRDWVQDIGDRNGLRNELYDAQIEIARLKAENWELQEDRRENDRLRTLVDAKPRYSQLDPIAATVTGRNPGVWSELFTINRGTLDGVQRNMAIINADGLIGIVYDAGLYWSKVRAIIDPGSSVAGRIERTRHDGILRGQITSSSGEATLNMYYLPAFGDVKPGDTVLTSGTDSRFPLGIPIGTVQTVSHQTEHSEQYVVVLPAVDFLHIENVLVLRTIVESDREEPLPRLPDPTLPPLPVFTPSPTPGASPGDQPEETDDGIFRFPTGGASDLASPSPTPTPSLGGIPEDRWAEES